ncbi:MAG: phosphoglucomutase/phosphomannomutase family protein [bacterium]
MKPIKFGTDGWRGVIADDFTFDRVGVVIQAIGEYLYEEGMAEKGVAIGYDNRFAAEEFAFLAATILTRQGIRVRLSATNCPTPVISYVTKYDNMGGGIMVTASHNPAPYNGIKFKPWYGGSAPPAATARFEARANELLGNFDVDAVRAQGPDESLLTREDFVPAFIKHVLTFVNVDLIRAASPRILIDPLYGSSIGVLDRALREVGCEVHMMHNERNQGFGGLHPEPIALNLGPFMEAIKGLDVDGGVASDGDGDRLAASTEDGVYLSPHHVFSLLLMHLAEDRGQTGGVVKTVSTTTMIDQLAARYELPVFETPIGFKYIGQLMMEQDIMIGGEESGGVGFRGHIPERDATLIALYLVEMMAMRKTTFSGLLAQLQQLVGDHAYDRIDVKLTKPVTADQFITLRANLPATVAGKSIQDVSEKDGLKLLFTDNTWLLLRASGTEPLLRVYAEAHIPAEVAALLETGLQLAATVGIEKAK